MLEPLQKKGSISVLNRLNVVYIEVVHAFPDIVADDLFIHAQVGRVGPVVPVDQELELPGEIVVEVFDLFAQLKGIGADFFHFPGLFRPFVEIAGNRNLVDVKISKL